MTHTKRVFKSRSFDRWARGILSDAMLCTAAGEVMAGQFEADLGGGLCKKRIATAGRGKSGGTRTLIAKRHKGAIFFIAGRQKGDPGTDFSEKQEAAARLIAKGLQAASEQKLVDLLVDGSIKEICT
ncbi:type II toxin-antitoxin system RelE/ParE family toxin [Ramlibacter sp.]|uniref:type II toxin-antitoxin system RelE/ParE family toxin n=1 Tax=Ramlibacter sp. TaxID=1917967 RepID=UPI003D09DC81